ncbi:alanine racemase [Candidatus Falkowbacteria bacterium CG10_big_fil_rev_8_21_14_0_10_43_11]|uniref:Alanine racemase n=1 Tax=Candidatus Falkowbacteria bacterium CG10_big_fil_rev_8_21_14_0_10_43_11 TaxID=1974568 RepID=A0A2M6WMZ8_9BACT|nr:MAG: alanine racemase [Candidatus Falkowbacteria bacterium CG10_big_fil_rev_8_21_14_0_10_43_11]
MNSLSWVEINTRAIAHNIKEIRGILPHGYKVAAVIKSNAYGHGMIPMARFLEKEKLADYLAVVNDEEALSLRAAKIKLPILVLSYWAEKNLPELIKNNIELAVYSIRQIKAIAACAETKHCLVSALKIHLKFDTGMRRLGFAPEEVERVIAIIQRVPQIKIQGIFSHFADAENEIFTKHQIEKFRKIVGKVNKRVKIPITHVAASAGSLFMRDGNFNMARIGIAMYGLGSLVKSGKLNLKPALSWKTKVAQVKKIKPGEKIGYGLTYQFKKAAKVAVLPIGYADGYDRRLSNCGEVIIKGKRCPVRGRACMNLMMAEVDKSAREGDEVILIGRQGRQAITADELAQKIGTINYEIIARINPEIKRIFK